MDAKKPMRRIEPIVIRTPVRVEEIVVHVTQRRLSRLAAFVGRGALMALLIGALLLIGLFYMAAVLVRIILP